MLFIYIFGKSQVCWYLITGGTVDTNPGHWCQSLALCTPVIHPNHFLEPLVQFINIALSSFKKKHTLPLNMIQPVITFVTTMELVKQFNYIWTLFLGDSVAPGMAVLVSRLFPQLVTDDIAQHLYLYFILMVAFCCMPENDEETVKVGLQLNFSVFMLCSLWWIYSILFF